MSLFGHGFGVTLLPLSCIDAGPRLSSDYANDFRHEPPFGGNFSDFQVHKNSTLTYCKWSASTTGAVQWYRNKNVLENGGRR